MRSTIKIVTLGLLISCIFIRCNGARNTDGEVSEEKTQPRSGALDSIKNLNNLEDEASKMEAMQAALKNLPKLSAEELKAFFPDELNGWKRTAYAGGDQAFGVNVSSGDAVYDAGDKELMLHLTDGAGETGAAIVSLAAMRHAMESEKESAYDVSKNEEINGVRAATRETKPQQEGNVIDADINFVYKDRYLIKLEGDGFSLDELKDVVRTLDYRALK